jgi:hypothetical protein
MISSNGELPWFEDILYVYYINTVKNTFPSFDFTTIFVAIFHIIGFYIIYLGVFLPPKYIYIHIIYLSIILISYYIFDKNCFMTLFANMGTSSQKTPIYLRMSTATVFLFMLLAVSIISVIYPNLSPFRIIKSIILKLEPI